jgi:hypothetical protein
MRQSGDDPSSSSGVALSRLTTPEKSLSTSRFLKELRERDWTSRLIMCGRGSRLLGYLVIDVEATSFGRRECDVVTGERLLGEEQHDVEND